MPFGEIGILDFFIGVVSANNIQHDLLLHSLRLIGNSCADTGMAECDPYIVSGAKEVSSQM